MGSYGKYEVVELIGEGGFGRVYRANDPVLKRAVAIKTCTLQHADMRERFMREAEIAASLRHPNILTVYDFGEHDGEPYLVQEYLPGEDLDVKIRRAEPLALATRVEWLRQVAEGLRHAHDRGIVHRDIKPGNIRILPDGQVRIMDFGIAKVLQAERQLTQVGFSVGTTGYLAPEQLAGEDIDHRADIFSFGVLAYELVTYRRPFEAETVTAILYRIAHEDPPPIADAAPACPPRLAACIERCLRKAREERWSSLVHVLAELDRIAPDIDGGPLAAASTGLSPAFPAATGVGAVGPAPTGTDTSGGPADPAASGAAQLRSPTRGAWRTRGRSPAMLALGAAALAVALFGVLNVVRWAEPAGSDPSVGMPVERPESAVGTDGTEPGDVAGVTGPNAVGDPGAAAPDGRMAERLDSPGAQEQADEVRGATPSGVGAAASPGGSATVAPAPPAVVPSAGESLDVSHILVVVNGGPEPARVAAESALIAELMRAGLAPVEDRAVTAMATQRGIQDAGRRSRTGTVLVGELHAQASPGVGRFLTGSATLALRTYDTRTGRLIGARTFQVGGGGVAGASAATETAAVTAAGESVGYRAARYAIGLLEQSR
jgi:serine/threonine-protein kinase